MIEVIERYLSGYIFAVCDVPFNDRGHIEDLPLLRCVRVLFLKFLEVLVREA